MVTLRKEELDELRAEHGEAAVKEHFRREEENVFGFGFKRDAAGKPVEMGVGSAAQPSANSIAAFEKYERDRPDFAQQLAKMKNDLAAYQAKRGNT